MRETLVGRAVQRSVALAAWAVCVSAAGGLSTGCAVSEADVHRWETTEAGPDKLYAIVTHDKYSWAMREEAALSLVRMKPRSGKRVGLEYLALGYDTQLGRVPGALTVINEDSRRKIVDGIAPKLVEMMSEPPPAKPADGTAVPPDPSVPYKDAAFALISPLGKVENEPPMANDEATKASLTGAITQWVQTDFEDRIDNSSQQYGVEQIMRFLGAPAVKILPATINETSTKVDRACALIADIGDDDTKKRASEALVAMAKKIDSPDWIEKQRPLVDDANKKQHIDATPDQVKAQLVSYQESELEKVFTNMKRVGMRPAIEYCLTYAHDKTKSEKMRTDALAALENRVDKTVQKDVDAIFDIIRDDSNPDKVRGLALNRFGELPKEVIVPKLYSLFTGKKWQVRVDAAKLVLKTMTPKDLPDFFRHLPQDEKTKMALAEPITYAQFIMAMDPQHPRDALKGYLESKDLSAKLTAIASYYQVKKSEAGSTLASLEDDKQPVSKCDPADDCHWTCNVNKEDKPVTTVGEFVKYCIEPNLQ
jgi:hypothetical protein